MQDFSNLAHELAPVRLRALKSLVFKLEHGVLNIADLVEEPDLLCNLLEWFNRPAARECEMYSEVCDLLAQFAEYPEAATILVEIGTVEFLTHLIEDERGQPWIETAVSVREKLVLLPDFSARVPELGVASAMSATGSLPSDSWQRTIAQPYNAVDAHYVDDQGSADRAAAAANFAGSDAPPEMSASAVKLPAIAGGAADVDVPSRGPMPTGLHTAANGDDGEASSVHRDKQTYTMQTSPAPTAASSVTGLRLDGSAHTFLVGSQSRAGSARTLKGSRYDQPGIPSADTTLKNNSLHFGGAAAAAAAPFDRPGSDFAPVALSVSDLNILHATAVKLSNRDTPMYAVETPCKFFKEILLQDFPAEVFLQHPEILHSLVVLMNADSSPNSRSPTSLFQAQAEGGADGDGNDGAGGNPNPASSDNDSNGLAIGCLESLVSMLVHRKTVVVKAADFQPAEGSWQFGEMPAADQGLGTLDFCRALFTHLESKLKDMRTLGSAMRLVKTLVCLLPAAPAVSLPPFAAEQESDSAAAMEGLLEERTAIRDCLAILSAVLIHHFEQQSFNILLVNLAMIFIETVERCVRPEDAPTITSAPLEQLIIELLSNEYMKESCPKIKEVLIPIVPHINPAFASSLAHLESIRAAMKRAVKFLTAKESFGAGLLDAPLGSTIGMLQHASAGLDALFYIQNPTFASTVVDLCLSSTGIVREVPSLTRQAVDLLARLLAFPNDGHRATAYARVQGIVENNPSPSVLSAATKVLQSPAILSRVVLALDDAVPAVSEASRWLFLQIAEPDEKTGTISRDLVEALEEVMPLLQAFSADDAIGWRVKELAADSIVDPRYSATATLLVPARAMFHLDPSVRQWAAGKLGRHKLLVHLSPRISADLIVGRDAANAFAVGGKDVESNSNSNSLHSSRAASPAIDPEAGWAEHSSEEACALVKVLANTDVNIKLRVSAADHIGQILQSGQHHAVLCQHRLFALALRTLEATTGAPAIDESGAMLLTDAAYSGSVQFQSAQLALAASCMSILHLLMAGSSRLRHSNQSDQECPAVLAAIQFLMAAANCTAQARTAAQLLIATVAFDAKQVENTVQLANGGARTEAGRRSPDLEDGTGTCAAGAGSVPTFDDNVLRALQASLCITPTMARCITLPHPSTVILPGIETPPYVEGYRRSAETIWCMLVLDGSIGMLAWREDGGISADQSIRTGEMARGRRFVGELIEPRMLPNDQGWHELQSLHSEVQLEATLDVLRDATTYAQVSESLSILEAHCLSSSEEIKLFCQLDWQSAFDRYISVAPYTETNAALLSRMLSFLAKVVTNDTEMPVPSMAWLAATTRNHLLNVLDGGSIAETSNEMASSAVVRELKCNILRLGIALLEDPRAFHIWGATGSAQCIVALMPHLMMGRDVEAENGRVYDLYVLTLCLRCTALLTGPAGCCCSGASDHELYGLTTELIGIANARSFSGDPEGRSFKGRRMCQLALMCTRQVAAALRTRGPLAWGPHWLWNGSIEWLAKQFSTREPVARVEALGLVSDFLHTVEGTTMLLQTHFAVRDGTLPLIDAMFAIIFDTEESSIVRCAATEVLTSFTIAGLHLPGLSPVRRGSVASVVSSNAGDASNPNDSSKDEVHPIVGMFLDQCFFQNLRPLIADCVYSSHLIEAIALLCNNLLAIDPPAVLQQLNHFAIWQSLSWVYTELHTSETTDPTDAGGKHWSRMTAQGAVMRTIASGLVAGGSMRKSMATVPSVATGTNAAGIALDVLSRKGVLEAAFAAISLPAPDRLPPLDDSEYIVRAGESACAALSVLMHLLESHPDGASIMWAHIVNDPSILERFLSDITSGNSESWHAATETYYYTVRLAMLQFFTVLFQAPVDAAVSTLVKMALDSTVVSSAPDSAGVSKAAPPPDLVQRQLYGTDATGSGSSSEVSEPSMHGASLHGSDLPLPSKSFGAKICMVLCVCWKEFETQASAASSNGHRLTKAAKDAISAVVAISSSAKHVGLETGLLDLIVSEIGHHHVALCMDGVEAGSSRGSKRMQGSRAHQQQSLPKNSTEAKDALIGVLGMLGNLVHENVQLKDATLRSSIPATLERIWTICTLDAKLLKTLLEVLCNMVAGDAADSSSCMAVPATNKNSIVRRCAKLACRLLRTNAQEHILRTLFDFLSTIVANSHCRGAMWREGLLEECLLQLTNRKLPPSGMFKFLACASHLKDTQTALCRSTPIIAAIVDHTNGYTTNNSRINLAAARILRNICFVRSARSMIAGNVRFMEVLRQLAGSAASGAEIQSCAQEALWSLLRHSNKTDRRRLWPNVRGVLQQKQLHMHDAMMAPAVVGD